MLFNSLEFMIFFPIVVILYYVIPAKIKYLWLLAASYYFYMCWNAKYALLILTSTIITYVSGLLIEKTKNIPDSEKRGTVLKKAVVAGSFLSNLGILFYFKYTNFFIDILTSSFAGIGIELNIPAIDVLLPVGISFYTFQALSYTMDVYRGEIYAEKNFFRYALFVSFFPQLVAGPIERSKNLLKQLAVPQKPELNRIRHGLLLMIWGFFLKVVLAERVAMFVDTIYNDYETYTGWYLIVATILFAVQIYCDFYGYSTIAMGASEIIGIKLMENFDAPYLSTSIAGFWRNWHISLTSWFKDYLYIPLGGSRKGKIRKFLNKLCVFLVSGLWHGADLSFVIWGGLNGIYQIIEELLKPLGDKIVKFCNLHRESIGHKIACGIVTFILVDFSWIFFRASSFQDSIAIVRSIFTDYNPWILFDGSLYNCGLDNKNFILMVISILVLAFSDICKRKGICISNVIEKQDYWCRVVTMIFAICFILIFGVWGSNYDAGGFIYFQF